MRPSEASKTIEGISTQGWVIFNNNQTGYYRVNYDQQNWDLITDQLLKDHTAISPINRAQIINDAMNLARAGKLYSTNFIKLIAVTILFLIQTILKNYF